MAITSLGYNVPDPESIVLSTYDVEIDGHSIVIDDVHTELPHWSIQSSVEVHFELELDLDLVKQQASLSQAGVVLGGVINWRSSRTGLHGASRPVTIVHGANSLSHTLDGSVLGGDLNLRASVVLLENPDPEPGSLCATIRGSRLWETSLRVQLEGSGSQFPTSAFDFEKAGFLPTTTMWKIDIDSTLESHISSAVRLKLNSGHPRVAEYLKDPNGKAHSEFQQFLRSDTVIQLLTFAVNSDLEQLQLDAEEEGTLAETLIQLHDVYFPNVSIHSTRETYLTDPSFLTATVHSSIFNPSRRMGK